MNILRGLFYMGQDKGKIIVDCIKRKRDAALFILLGILVMTVCCGLYGYAMGIGTSPLSAWRDALKIAMIFIIGFIISLPPCLLIFKLTNSKLQAKIIMVGLFSSFFMTSLVLGISAPFSFLYGLIWNIGGKIIHIVLIDLAIIIGLYIMGTIFYHAVEKEKQTLVLPLILTFLFILLAVYLLIQFFGPYFINTSYFCEGVKRLQEIFKPSCLTV